MSIPGVMARIQAWLFSARGVSISGLDLELMRPVAEVTLSPGPLT